MWFWRSSQRCLDQGPKRVPVRRHQVTHSGPLYVGDLANVRRKEIKKEAKVWVSMGSQGGGNTMGGGEWVYTVPGMMEEAPSEITLMAGKQTGLWESWMLCHPRTWVQIPDKSGERY